MVRLPVQMNRSICSGSVLLLCLALAGASLVSPLSASGNNERLAVIHGPYLQAPTASSMTIVWFTNKKCVAKVEYAPLQAFADPSVRKTARSTLDGLVDAQQTRHVITLQGLMPGEQYGYRILATEITKSQPYRTTFGEMVSMERMRDLPLSFNTLDPTKSSCSVSVVSDIHEKSSRLAAMLDHVPWESTDLLFLNGDMLNHFENEQQIFRGFLDVCVSRFATRIPLVLVRGNHETRGAMARQLRDYFPSPRDRYYYHFQQGPVRFLVLDSGEDKPDDSPEYSGLVEFEPYRTQQTEWLKKTIADPEFQQAPYKIVFTHMPLFGGNNWHGEQRNRELWLPLLNQARIDLALSGHTHQYARIDAREQENRFPIIIGDPQNVIRVDARSDGLNVIVKNADGSLKDELRLPKRGKDLP